MLYKLFRCPNQPLFQYVQFSRAQLQHYITEAFTRLVFYFAKGRLLDMRRLFERGVSHKILTLVGRRSLLDRRRLLDHLRYSILEAQGFRPEIFVPCRQLSAPGSLRMPLLLGYISQFLAAERSHVIIMH